MTPSFHPFGFKVIRIIGLAPFFSGTAIYIGVMDSGVF
jgi:hypothetical protein